MKPLKLLFVGLFVALAFTACNEDAMNPTGISVDALNTASIVTPPTYCGGPYHYELKGGPDFNYTGSVSVANDGNFILIKVISLKGFQQVIDGSIDIGFYRSSVPQSMPVTSSFKYHFTPTDVPNEYGIYIYDISIPINEIIFEDDQIQVGLKCGQPVNIIVHVDVLMEVVPSVITSEDAWGAGIWVSGYSENGTLWRYKYISFTPACCTCDGETAWANGNPYPGNNWALYTPYTTGSTITVNLLAGQYNIAGTVTLKPSATAGMVTISIDLNEGENWGLQNVTEPIKIQGYKIIPTNSPIPGKFTTFKGNLIEVTVPKFAFYGIHVDVQKCRF